MITLVDIGAVPAGPTETISPGETTTVSAPSAASQPWGMMKHFRPSTDPVFAGDLLARLFDTGVPYGNILAWLDAASYHRRPHSQVDLLARWWLGPSSELDARPVPVMIALTRGEDETERDHLVRAGHEAALFDTPGVDQYQIDKFRDRYLLLGPSFGVRPTVAMQEILAVLPTTPERVRLLGYRALSHHVLDVLLDDPNPVVRTCASRHVKSRRRTLTT